MKNRLGIVLMFVGAALVLSALALFLHNRQEESQAQQAADAVLPQLIERIETRRPALSDPAPSETPLPGSREMTVVEIDGYGYIGYLYIPSLELELPVMAEWDYDRLKTAPCRYAGSTFTDDLVLLAHSYRRHFKRLSELSVGDAVCFIDMDGVMHSYEVAAMDILEPTAVQEMLSGEYDLTLFTCTYGGKNRITVRCVRTTIPG